jgi:hypothetical protein
MRCTNGWLLGALCWFGTGGLLACSSNEQSDSGDAPETTVVGTRFEPIEPPEGFLECVGEEADAQFGDVNVDSLPGDDTPALVELLPDVVGDHGIPHLSGVDDHVIPHLADHGVPWSAG